MDQVGSIIIRKPVPVLVVERSIKLKRIDLNDYAASIHSDEYAAFYESKAEHPCGVSELTLDGIEDEKIRRVLTTVVYEEMQTLNVRTFHSEVVCSLRQLLKCRKDLFFDRDDFFAYFSFPLTHSENMANTVYSFSRKLSLYCSSHRFSQYTDNDVWRLCDLLISPERIGGSKSPIRYFDFAGYRNESTKALVKQYIFYQLYGTDHSITTINGKRKMLKGVLKDFDGNFAAMSDQETEDLVNTISAAKTNPKSRAETLMLLKEFCEYLVTCGQMDHNPYLGYTELMKYTYDVKTTAPDHESVIKMFRCLRALPKCAQVYFLLHYQTAMRESEVLNAKKVYLTKRGESYYIDCRDIKMKKGDLYEISAELYAFLLDYISSFLPKDTDLFFPSPYHHDRHMSSDTLVNLLTRTFQEAGITNPDGTPYSFKPHSFRHLRAVRMRDADIPITFIQEQLHHKSPEMTMAYLEHNDRYLADKTTAYYNGNGIKAPVDFSGAVSKDDLDYASFMRKTIDAQALPDGICARPVILGKCVHCNKCLSCDEFRTSKEYLPVHKEHLRRAKILLQEAEEKGLERQRQTCLHTKIQLEQLISVLEAE